jgi:hypothetical protein
MPPSWRPVLALAATLLPLLWVKGWITDHLQELTLRWVGDRDVALILYFVVVLPGVVIHELSHWLAATLLGVRVRRLSIGPVRKAQSNRVSLGSVQVGRVDPVRASLIGLAPLLGGSAMIVLIGTVILGAEGLTVAVATHGVPEILAELERLVHVPDLWLWLYLIFAVSNAMLPSESDMQTVRPVLIFLAIVAAAVLVVGGVPSIPDGAVRAVDAVARFLASAFALTLAADVVVMVVIWLLVWWTRWLQSG